MNAVRWGLGHLGAENYILAWVSEVSKVWFFGFLELWFIGFLELWIIGSLEVWNFGGGELGPGPLGAPGPRCESSW